MDPKKLSEFSNHELILSLNDTSPRLKGFIAIHNTNLGPALGATRFWHYKSEEDALRDALRLSKMMTYKCVLAGLPFGGGKGVIMADKNFKKPASLIREYAKAVDSLNGKFYTGEDVGMEKKDVAIMAKTTPFVIGKIRNKSDRPAYWAALGVFYAAKAALGEVFDFEKISGRIFAVKGLGKVGSYLCEMIFKEGGNVIGADINSEAVKSALKKFPKIRIVKSEEIFKQKADVYSPCALAGDLNKKDISKFKTPIICGGANNQLVSREDGEKLHKLGILYIPDYLANAGGLINVADELHAGGYKRVHVERGVRKIKDTAKKIIQMSKRQNKATNEMADKLAEEIFCKPKRVC